MKFRVLVCALAALLASCSNDVSPQKEGVSYSIKRNEFNEFSIRVDRAPKGEADLVLFRLQGREQARDNFISMDMKRRAGRGTLSEITFEPHALRKDREAIAMGLVHAVERKHRRIMNEFPREYSYLQAFAEGVNEYLEEVKLKEHDLGSREARLLAYYRDPSRTNNAQYYPAKWDPRDSIAIFQNIAFYLSTSLPTKLPAGELGFREQSLSWANIVSKARGFLGKEDKPGGAGSKEDPTEMMAVVKKLFDPRPIYPSFILDADPAQNLWRTAGIIDPDSKPPVRVAAEHLPRSPFHYQCREMGYPVPECPQTRGMSVGSNSWVVSGSKTKTGSTYLLNDPHLQMGYPMNFTLMALNSKPAADPENPFEGFKGRGMHVAGIPGWLIGSNEDIAWGFTNFGADVDDVILEKTTPDGKSVIFVENNGKGPTREIPIESEIVELQVRQRDGSLKTVPVQYRWVAHHGPIVSDGMTDLTGALKEVSEYYKAPIIAAYRWTGHEATWTQLENHNGRGTEVVAQLRLNRASNFSEFKEAIGHLASGMQNIVYADNKSEDGNIGYYTSGLMPRRPYASSWSPLFPILGWGRFEWAPDYRRVMPELYNPSKGRIITANNDPFGSTEKEPFKDYIGFFSTGSRSQRITEEIDRNLAAGTLDLASMQQIQFDHVDRTVTAFLALLRKHQGQLAFANDSAERKLVNSLLNFNGDMDRDLNPPVLADAWLNHLQNVFIEKYYDLGIRDQVMKRFRRRVEFVTTMYHVLETRDVDWVRDVLEVSLQRATDEIEKKSLRSVVWGEVHKVGFWNPLEKIMKLAFVANFPRDGYYETPDVAGPTFGPNFRLIQTINHGKPVEMMVAVPGGNYDPTDRTKISAEFRLWLDGGYRAFPDHI